MDSTAGFAYWFADSAIFPALYDRMRTDTIDAVRRGGLPDTEDVVAFVCARDDRELDLALAVSGLAADGGALGRRVVAKLVAGGDPEVAAALFRTVAGRGRRRVPTGPTPRETALVAIFAAVTAPTAPGWREPGGLVPSAAAGLIDDKQFLASDFVPFLTAPFADLVTLAVERLAPHLAFADWVRAARAALRDGGAAWLRKTADTVAELPEECGDFRTELAGLLRRAASAPNPDATLEQALDGHEPPTPASLLLALRTEACDTATETVDWTVITAVHERRALPDEFLVEYAHRADCPWELLADLHQRRPHELPEQYALPWESLEVRPKHVPYVTESRARVLRRGLRNGWFPIRRLLCETGTALEVLDAVGVDAEWPDEVHDALAELVAPLGADPAAWLRVYTQLPRFRGTCAVLVDGAVAHARRHPEPKWPRRTDTETPARLPQGARAALALLLAAAGEGTAAALAPYLDPRAVQDVLRYSRLGPADRDAILAAHGPRAAVWWAAARPTAEDDLALLLALDDPDVNAMLFRYTRIGHEERRRILAGLPYGTALGTAHRTRDIPVADDLVEALAHHEIGDVRPWLLLCVDSGDPGLLRIMLGRAKVYSEAARLRLLVRLWVRHGPAAVEALLDETVFPTRRTDKHPLPPATLRTAREALASPDGLRVLREAADREASPDAVAAYLIGRGGAVVGERAEHVVAELGAIPWDAVLARHAAKPMNDEALEALAARPDCPRELLLALVERCPTAPRALTGAAGRVLTPGDILHRASPAAQGAALLSADMRNRAVRFAAAGAELRAVLGDDADAWTVATRLLPDFSGTMAELAATAAAAVGR
ncbi:hypothetical protein LO772_18400 [Yinghuangia sp. ASG 101]|uniref:hypothetical protein n=1 Tax=Yinghuangia sp. ASG 101 TaxID=2896848 RepID=UPI001E2E2660|nr:hypothetical protein [Yinghuangia sp. ASG 101]UGQ08954.1 hypothetical protein LO772_18400 [Yinghuangia sp. ASG 101]